MIQKRIVLFFLIGFSCLVRTGGIAQNVSSNEELFEQGNEAYKSQDYQKAIELYRQILGNGYESSHLYYNLGNAYFKLGQLAPSVLNYERAARIDPSDEDVQQNLRVVRQGVIDRFEEVPKPLVKQAYLGIMLAMNSDSWAWLSVILFLIFAGGLALYLFTPWRRPGFIAMFSGFILGIICLGFAYAQNNYREHNRSAIVMVPSSYVKSAPSSAAEDVFILHEGTKATVTDQLEGWKKIRVPDGKIGWIKAEDVEEV